VKITLALRGGSQTRPVAAPAWIMQTLQEITVTQGDGGKEGEWTQGIQVHLRAERGKNRSADFKVLDTTFLKPGNRLIVTLAIGAANHVLIDSIITERRLQLDDNGGSVYVQGTDLSVLMSLVTRDVAHPGMADKEIVSQIVTKHYQKFGISPRVSAPASSWKTNPEERVPRQVATDLEYIRELARRHSFIFMIKPSASVGQCEAWWGREDTAYKPSQKLIVAAGPASNVERIDPVENAMAPTRTFGAVEAGKPGELMKIDVQASSDKLKLAKTSGLEAYPGLKRLQRSRFSGPYAKEAEALAQAATDKSTRAVLRVGGSLDTFRYGDVLRAPGRVQLLGAGNTYSGEYRVTKVTHTISRASYKQEFELEREGTGAK
jgi:hypothetical protein